MLVGIDAHHAIEQHKQRRHGPAHRPQRQGLQHAAAGAVGMVKQHSLPDQAVVALGKQGRIRGQQRHTGQWHHQVGVAGVFRHEAGQHPAHRQHAQCPGPRGRPHHQLLAHAAPQGQQSQRQHQGGQHQRLHRQRQPQTPPAAGSLRLVSRAAQHHEHHGQRLQGHEQAEQSACRAAGLFGAQVQGMQAAGHQPGMQGDCAYGTCQHPDAAAQETRQGRGREHRHHSTQQSAVPGVGRAAEQLAPGHLPGGECAQALLVPGALGHFVVDTGHHQQAAPTHGEAGEQHRAGDEQVVARVVLAHGDGQQGDQGQHPGHQGEAGGRNFQPEVALEFRVHGAAPEEWWESAWP